MRYNKIFYEPCSNVDMIRRILRNLSFSFQKLGQTDKVEETEELLECLNPKKLSSPESEE